MVPTIMSASGIGVEIIVERLTMNVADFATSEPHVSAMISKVNAFVPTSIPLLTKISSGRLPVSRDGRKVVSVALDRVQHSQKGELGDRQSP